MNFRTLKKNSDKDSNYRLLGRPVQLTVKVNPVLDGPEDQAWENEGGAISQPYELVIDHRVTREVRMRLGRKQIAARRVIPKEIIKVPLQGKPVVLEVGVALYEGRTTPEQLEVARLEHAIRELMGIAGERQRKVEAIAKLREKYERRRTK